VREYVVGMIRGDDGGMIDWLRMSGGTRRYWHHVLLLRLSCLRNHCYVRASSPSPCHPLVDDVDDVDDAILTQTAGWANQERENVGRTSEHWDTALHNEMTRHHFERKTLCNLGTTATHPRTRDHCNCSRCFKVD
jgi:hypothetical protein